MNDLRNAVGQRHGRLTVVGIVPKRSTRWLVQCDCGTVKSVIARTVSDGRVQSCGCLSAEKSLLRNSERVQHGHAKSVGHPSTRTYRSWLAMKTRCSYRKHPAYDQYGGRGIAVCPRWADSFIVFLADMGERPEGMTLDRVDPDGNYEPGNCRWATPSVQSSNQRGVSSPHMGVSFIRNARKKPWRATLRVDGRNKHLGVFATEDEARQAVLIARDVTYVRSLTPPARDAVTDHAEVQS